MLQILVHGPNQVDYLELSPGTTLQIQDLQPAFDEELAIGEYSLPIDVPWTNHNRRLLGFIEMLQPGSTDTYYWSCDVFSDGLPEIIDGKLTLLKTRGKFNFQQGSYSFSISGNKGLFGTLIRNKKLTDLNLGGRISWSTVPSRGFATNLMKGQYPQYSYIAFAPVAIEQFFDEDRLDYAGEIIVFDRVNATLATGSGSDDWSFARPQSASPETPTSPGTEEYVDFRTIPFFNLYYLIKQVFAEHGYQVTGEFFSTGYFNDLYLFNNFAIEKYNESFIDTNREILPKNHVPDILIKDFLIAANQFFNTEMIFRANRTVEFRYKQGKLKNRNSLDVTSITDGSFESEMLTFQDEGFTLKFDFDSEDSYPGDRIQDLKDLTIVGTVSTRTALNTIDPGRDLTTRDIAFVRAENMYYKVADATVIPALWDAFSENLDEMKIGKGDNSISTLMTPLCTYVREDSVSALVENQEIAGARMKGSFFNTKGAAIVNPFGLRVFYIQKESQGGAQVPISFVHNRDDNNIKRVPISLSWTGQEGLFEMLFKGWISFLQKTIQINTKLNADHRWLDQISNSGLLEINGVLYVIQSITKQLPLKGPIELNAYRF